MTLNKLENLDAKTAADSEAARGATTDMEGAFSIPEVATGRYLVLVELAGYVSGISGLDAEAREHLKNAARTPPEGSTVIDVANDATIDVSAKRPGDRLVAQQRTDPTTLNQITAYTYVQGDQGGTLTLCEGTKHTCFRSEQLFAKLGVADNSRAPTIPNRKYRTPYLLSFWIDQQALPCRFSISGTAR